MIDLGLENRHALVSGAGNIPERAGHGRHVTLQLARQVRAWPASTSTKDEPSPSPTRRRRSGPKRTRSLLT